MPLFRSLKNRMLRSDDQACDKLLYPRHPADSRSSSHGGSQGRFGAEGMSCPLAVLDRTEQNQVVVFCFSSGQKQKDADMWYSKGLFWEAG